MKDMPLRIVEEESVDTIEDRVAYLEEVVDWLVSALIDQAELLEDFGITRTE